MSLTSGVKKTNNIRDFASSLGYPFGAGTTTFNDSQGIIQAIKVSRIHGNTIYLATKISWLNEQYVAGIIKLLYTKTTLQLADVNTKPLCGKHLQAMLSCLVGVHYYPQSDTNHYQSLYLDHCQLLKDYIRFGRPIPISENTIGFELSYILHIMLSFSSISQLCDPLFCSFKALTYFSVLK
jgi:hypothetical protein